MERSEKKNKRIGMITSLGIHGLLALLFILSMAWRAPDPPLPEFGIELNIGFDTEGTGDEQIDTETATETTQETQSEDEPVESTPEETAPEVQPEKNETPVEEVVTSKLESDVVVKEEKKEKPKEEVKKVEPEKPKEEPKKPEPEKVKVEYKKEDAKVTDKATETKGTQPLSEGDDKNKTGNKGDPKGTLNPDASYTGKPGGGAGGDGLSLAMPGWAWADEPNINAITDTQPGKIVLEIECDADGEIVRVTAVERGLSPKTEQMLIEAIRKSSLMKTADGQAPDRSKGKVVFVLKAR